MDRVVVDDDKIVARGRARVRAARVSAVPMPELYPHTQFFERLPLEERPRPSLEKVSRQKGPTVVDTHLDPMERELAVFLYNAVLTK